MVVVAAHHAVDTVDARALPMRLASRDGGLLGIDGGLVLAILGLRFGFLAFTLLLAESKQSHGFLISLYRLQP